MRATALLCCALFSNLIASPEARAQGTLDERVAMYRALVRDEPFAMRAADPSERGWVCPGSELRGLRLTIRRAVRDASFRFAVPAALIHSVIRHESAYDPRAVSHVGAMGLMQLMPATARELGVACPSDPRQNVLGGTRYLRELRDRFGSWASALAAYNAGPSRVAQGRIPPVTRLYVRRVMASWQHPEPEG